VAKKLLSIDVRGTHKKWGFVFVGDPKHIDEWRADGLDVNEIENMIPEWVADAGLVRPWCFLQDLLNFRNPWRK
jgi:hypothetical protein